MANLMDFLQFQLSDDLVSNLTEQIGESDPNKTYAAANGIFSFLTNALSRNTSNEQGASLLAGALDRDHDGSIIDDVFGLLSGRSAARQPKMMDGAGILGHILQGNQNSVIDTVARMSGLNQNSTMNLMIKLAPMVLGVLGRVKKQKRMDHRGLSSFLNESATTHNQQLQGADLITRVLDKDGDGSMMDEVAEMGLKALGNFFKR